MSRRLINDTADQRSSAWWWSGRFKARFGRFIDAVAKAARVSKPTIYLRWDGKEQLPIDALASHIANVGDVDTGTLRGDLSIWRATFSTSRATGPAAIVADGSGVIRSACDRRAVESVGARSRRTTRCPFCWMPCAAA